MIPRDAESILREHAKGYPVVALTGPRPSGKTTLARAVFAGKPYVSLENPAMREFADTDPQGFFRQYADGAVYDTGLVTWLLGIEEARQIRTHPLRGALFETWVVGELVKKRLNTGPPANLSFWRDRAGHEVDLLLPESPGVRPVEIKSGATLQRNAWRNLAQWRDMAGAEAGRPILVYGGDEAQRRSDVDVLPWREV